MSAKILILSLVVISVSSTAFADIWDQEPAHTFWSNAQGASAPGIVIDNMPPETGARNVEPGETVVPKQPNQPDQVKTPLPGAEKPPKTGSNPPKETTPPTGTTNDWAHETAQCRTESVAAASACNDKDSDVRSRLSALDRTGQSLSGNTGVACGQLARDAASLVSSLTGAGNSCADRVNRCRNACEFVRSMSDKDDNFETARVAYNRCSTASKAHSSLLSSMDQASRAASNYNRCFSDAGGQTNTQLPNGTTPTHQVPTLQDQQRQLQQANCATNPRGCGAPTTEAFAPTNLPPAGLPSELGMDGLEPVAGPGNIRIPFDGSELIKSAYEGRGRTGGAGEPPRGSGARANVASDFSHAPPAQKPKRFANPAARVGAEVYRGLVSPTDTTQPRTRAAQVEGRRNQNAPLRPIVGARVVPPAAGLSKFQGKAQELRQIWSQNMREASQRGVAGSEYRGFVPTGVDGLTGPHVENFKKIRGRFQYLERSLAK